MEEKFIKVTIGIYEDEDVVASCYQEEIVPMKYQVTMETIKADIKKNLSKKMFAVKADKGKLPDMLYVEAIVDKTKLISENWCILDEFYGKFSINDLFVMDSSFIEKVSNDFAEKITDRIYHFVPNTLAFKLS